MPVLDILVADLCFELGFFLSNFASSDLLASAFPDHYQLLGCGTDALLQRPRSLPDQPRLQVPFTVISLYDIWPGTIALCSKTWGAPKYW